MQNLLLSAINTFPDDVEDFRQLANTPVFPVWFKILLAVQILTMIVMAWMAVVAATGLIRRRRLYSQSTYRNRFAVVVCARDEEKVIHCVLDSLREQNYPENAYHVFVLADHCSDRTAAIAKQYSFVTVMERRNGRTDGKGNVLGWGIPKILRRYGSRFDAFAFFDADNVVSPNFLLKMNDALNSGDEVIQGNRLAGRPFRTVITRWYALYWAAYTTFFEYPREKNHLSCYLTGTGFVCRKSLLRKGWHTQCITEDVEFALQNTLAGHRVGFCQEAVCYDEQPHSLPVTFRQLCRWCTGSYQIIGRYLGRWFSGLHRKKGKERLRILDFMVMMIMGPCSWIGNICGIFTNLYLLDKWPIAFWIMVLFAPVVLIGSWIGVAKAAKFNHIDVRRMIPSLLTFPVFMMIYTLCSIRTFFVHSRKWHRIEHSGLDSTAVNRADQTTWHRVDD